MHPKLSKQPLTYVVAQVKFSSIEDIAKYVPQLQDKIRDFFPHYLPVNIQAIQLIENQQPSATTLAQWHFMDKEKHTGIVLDKQSIIIHTSCYDQFKPLLSSLEKVISHFHSTLNISLFTQVGLRYINLIENGLTKIDSGLRGFKLLGNEFDKEQFLTRTETVQRSHIGVVKIQATQIENKDVLGNIENIFVPLDLQDTSRLLSFKHYSEPKAGFLILDIDHINTDQGDFDASDILSRLTQLQKVIYQVFCQAAGKENIHDWT